MKNTTDAVTHVEKLLADFRNDRVMSQPYWPQCNGKKPVGLPSLTVSGWFYSRPKTPFFYHYPAYLRRGSPQYTLFSLIDQAFTSARLIFLIPLQVQFAAMSTDRVGNKCYICIWLGQSLLYTVLLRIVALHRAGSPLRRSRLAHETGIFRLHGILRVINTLCSYCELV
jgi:hypothetical protein